jgi:hypothetical protein
MSDIELERAWRAAEPPPGFPDRVLDQLDAGPALDMAAGRRASSGGWGRRWRWVALAAVTLALAGLFLRSWMQPAGCGDLIAEEPRVVPLGEHVVAEMSSGAHIRCSRYRWSGCEVQQERGAVTYRVEPGTPFRVQTQHGSVSVLGTVFHVVVADGDEAGGETMKKQWAIAGAAAALGALLFVSVEQGVVRFSKGEEALTLTAGQSVVIGPDGVPHRGAETSGAALAPAEPQPQGRHEPGAPRPGGVRRVSSETERLRQRVLDSLQTQARDRAADSARTEPSGARHAPGTMVDRTGELSPEAMRVLNHEFIPMVSECYDQARERNPQLRGMLAINLHLASADDVGSVVEAAEPEPTRNQVHDDELIECVRQSAFSIQLPMPENTGRTSLQLTIPLGEPLPADAGR